MQFTCPQCNKQLDESHINQDLAVVTCSNCDAIFSVPYSFAESNPRKAEFNNEVLRPPMGFKVIQNTNYLEISRTVDGCEAGCVVFMFVIFTAPLLISFVISQPLGYVKWILSALLIFILVAFYYKSFFDRSVIRVDKDGLQISSRPIRFRPPKKINASDINQLYVVKSERRKERYSIEKTVGYSACLVTHDNRRYVIFGGFAKVTHALYFEKQIESILGVQDHIVDGESRF